LREGTKIILFGATPMGLSVAAQLRGKGLDPLLADDDEAALAAAAARGFRTAKVNCLEDGELQAVGIGRDAGLVFCLFQNDPQNVFLTLSARALAPELEIVSLTQSGESAQTLLAAGADKVIDPYEISGRKIHDLIRRPLVAETLEHTVFGQQDLSLAEVVVAAGSPLHGRTLDGLEVNRSYNLLLLGVVDREHGNDFVFAIGQDGYRLDPGDVLVVIGPEEAIAGFKRDACC